jgi:hypothetical protein
MRHPRKFTNAEWTGIWDRIRQRVTPPLRRTSLRPSRELCGLRVPTKRVRGLTGITDRY